MSSIQLQLGELAASQYWYGTMRGAISHVGVGCRQPQQLWHHYLWLCSPHCGALPITQQLLRRRQLGCQLLSAGFTGGTPWPCNWRQQARCGQVGACSGTRPACTTSVTNTITSTTAAAVATRHEGITKHR